VCNPLSEPFLAETEPLVLDLDGIECACWAAFIARVRSLVGE
jgi:hypothetical protein